MAVRQFARPGDILISIILICVGIAGLYMIQDFPDRAAMWPSWIMMLLIFFPALHLLVDFWKRRATGNSGANRYSSDRTDGEQS